MIPYGRQDINNDDIQSVLDVLKSDFLTQGPKVPLFEKKVMEYTGAKYALAMNSATSALHVACLALGVSEGDTVWTTPVTFVATANCALYCGADVDFVDIDEKTYNICPLKLEEKLTNAAKEGKLPKVVIPVHLTGQSCEMEKIHLLSLKYGFKIIEDASHAIGGKYKEKPIGCGEFSDITIFSFHPVKIITTAEGGMALTNNLELSKKMELFRSHGITRDESAMRNKSDGPWYYEQIELGYNYRMTELQAALGVSQMIRLNDFIEKRHQIASYYFENLKETSLVLPFQEQNTYSAYHLYVIKTKERQNVYNFLREKSIYSQVHYIPIHTQPYYVEKYGKKEFKVAENYYRESLSLPMYYSLKEEDLEFVVKSVKEALRNSHEAR